MQETNKSSGNSATRSRGREGGNVGKKRRGGGMWEEVRAKCCLLGTLEGKTHTSRPLGRTRSRIGGTVVGVLCSKRVGSNGGNEGNVKTSREGLLSDRRGSIQDRNSS